MSKSTSDVKLEFFKKSGFGSTIIDGEVAWLRHQLEHVGDNFQRNDLWQQFLQLHGINGALSDGKSEYFSTHGGSGNDRAALEQSFWQAQLWALP